MKPGTLRHMPPILYSFRRCPYAMRARLALAVGGLHCELREVVLRSKPAQLLEASPKGTVPVLVLPGGVIEQSLDIMLWALEQHDPDGWLEPGNGSMAQMLELIEECDGPFKHGLDRYKYPDRYEASSSAIDHRERCGRWLKSLEDRLVRSAQLFGERPALADAAIMPFVRQFSQVDRAWFDMQPWPALRAWLDAWLASPLFGSIMVKHPPWDGRAGVRFP